MSKTSRTVLLTAFLVIASTAPGRAQIIPDDRTIDWSDAGIPGGIPERTTICATIDAATYGTGTTDATAALQDAIDGCPDDQVVYIPAGTYMTTGTVHLYSHKTIRGDGPGQTILSYQGGGNRSILDIRGSVYWEITGLDRSYAVTGGTTLGSTSITLEGTGEMAVGDILLIDQLNDGELVDPEGVEGLCTYCGREEGTRVLGQFAEITAIDGNTVSIHPPLHWTYDGALSPEAVHISASAMVRWAGIEDLTLTQTDPVVEFLIEMDGAQYSWVRNVEIERIQRRAIWLIESLQNDIRGCYFHEGIDGYGRDRGYGLLVDAYSTANLVENNIFVSLDGGFMMTAGGASGNVFAYNYMEDSRFDDEWWLTCSPSINHAPHPKMNLWEGNIGIKAEGDIIHGSSSHNTIFRSQSKGWQSETTTTRNNAVEFASKNTFMNVVGCVLGTAGRSNRYEVLPGQAYDDWAEAAIWVLGVGSGIDDPGVAPTILRHGNWDYVTNDVVWDPAIADHVIPASLYLAGPPSWWGCRAWPPIGPDVDGLVSRIPAQDRYEGVPDPTCPDGDEDVEAADLPDLPPDGEADAADAADAVPDGTVDTSGDPPGDDAAPDGEEPGDGGGDEGCGCSVVR
jgi:hypothetical protein